MIRLATIIAAAAVLAGCAGPPTVPGSWDSPTSSLPPGPVVELIGKAQARELAPDDLLTTGLGADAVAGDLVLENSLVRFVIAGPDRVALGGPGGNVVDAVLTGQADRIRLLAPLVGPQPSAVQPVYENVVVTAEGGVNEAAVVTAEGWMCGRRDVLVTTTYKLGPDSDSLDIVTRVTNGSGASLRRFSVQDRLCHGRSYRFSPSVGLAPRGDGGEGTFLAIFDDNCSWGIVCYPMEGYRASSFKPGESILDYGPSDIQPGGSRFCRRSLVAVHAGPDEIWRRAYLSPSAGRSRFRFKVITDGGGVIPPHFELGIVGDVSPAAMLALGDRSGIVDVDVLPGLYNIGGHSPGFSSWGPVSVRAEPEKMHFVPVRFAPPAMLTLDLKAEIGGIVGPTQARIVDYPVTSEGATNPPAPAFPVWPPRGVKLAGALKDAAIPLAPGGTDAAGNHLVVVSRGPLFDVQSARIQARPGQDVPLSVLLRRVVDPGSYMSVDFRQYDDASPESPLTVGERVASNRCEGVDVGLVAHPLGSDRGPLADYRGQEVLSAVRLEVPGGGLMTVWDVKPEADAYTALRESLSACTSPAQAIQEVRKVWPDARIAVHKPFEPGSGVLAMQGWKDPRQDAPGRLKVDFDALELLTGRDVDGARAMLDAWFLLLNRGHMVMAVGASGSRGIFGDEAGVARTFVMTGREDNDPARSVARVLGREWRGVPTSFVSNGPFLEAWLDGAPMGTLLGREPGQARLRIRLRTAQWVPVDNVAIYRNGRLVRRIEVTDRKAGLDETIDVSALEDCWFVVVADGAKPMTAAYGFDAPRPFAATNPIWVDADKDGEISIAGF